MKNTTTLGTLSCRSVSAPHWNRRAGRTRIRSAEISVVTRTAVPVAKGWKLNTAAYGFP